MANINDVAKEAGVSKSTVSRVINKYEGVNDNKRMKVLQAIKRLNYVPNETARALALNRTNTIGVIAKELADEFYGVYIRNLHYHADYLHYGVVYCEKNNYGYSNIDYLGFLNKKIDGYIFLGEMTVSNDELMTLSRMHFPVVIFEKRCDIKGITSITINNRSAVFKALDYLVNIGHRKILNVGKIEKNDFLERNVAYDLAIEELGLDYCKTFNTKSFILEDIRELAKEVYNEIINEGITAAFCTNNVVATGIIDGLIDLNIRIPEDFSVIGFDDIRINQYTNNMIPPITSIKQPQHEMSEYAIDSLIKMVKTGVKDYSKEFECELKIRKSTSPR